MTIDKYKEIITYLKEILWKTDYYGHVFCVGGCVRDKIMGNEVKDIDICVNIPNGGIEFSEWMEKNGYTEGSVVVYPTYGTAMFRLKKYPDVELECVQTRKEQYKDKNSRNPETCYGTMREDCFRRDLTINSLYYDISHNKVIDLTGNGINDIENHIIRVTSTPDIVYEDDPLRILRCIRFASRFGWEISKDTYDGMVRNVDRLSIITKERIQDELNKMLVCDRPVMAMELMKNIGAMKYVIPELEETYELKQNKYHFGTCWQHTLKVVDGVLCNKYLEVRMSALLHDIGKIKTTTYDDNGDVHFYQHELASAELCKVILRRLKYSNDFIESVMFLVKNHMITKNWGDDCSHMKLKTLRKLQYKCNDYERFLNLLALIDADNKAHAPEYCMPNQVKNIFNETLSMRCIHYDSMFGYKLPIDGEDVMRIKGLKPGREVKECLDYALKLAFNDPKMSRDVMLKHIKGYKLKKNENK